MPKHLTAAQMRKLKEGTRITVLVENNRERYHRACIMRGVVRPDEMLYQCMRTKNIEEDEVHQVPVSVASVWEGWISIEDCLWPEAGTPPASPKLQPVNLHKRNRDFVAVSCESPSCKRRLVPPDPEAIDRKIQLLQLETSLTACHKHVLHFHFLSCQSKLVHGPNPLSCYHLY